MEITGMTFAALIFVIIGTAFLSAILTLALAAYIYRARYQQLLEKEMLRIAAEIESRVRKGTLEAGQELLPQFQDRVRDGFIEAMRRWGVSDDLRNIAKTGADLVGDGISGLLGRKNPTK